MTMEIRAGRGVGKNKDHIHLHLDHLDPKILHERLPGISESAKIFAGVDVTKEPIPVLPTVHYNMGGIPTNYHGEVLTLKNGNPDTVVPGLMALGEAACVSVHGANRLGSNSLIDLVVFGRAAGLRCAEIVDAERQACRPAEERRRARALAPRPVPPRQRRHADRASCASRCRRPCRTTARSSAPARCWRRARSSSTRSGARPADIKVTDRSLIWNTDLLETLEFDNLIGQAVVTMEGAAQPPGIARRPCPRGFPRARRQELDEAHARLARRHLAQGERSITARCTPTRCRTRSSTSSRRRGCTERRTASATRRFAARRQSRGKTNGPVQPSQELPLHRRQGLAEAGELEPRAGIPHLSLEPG